MSADYKEGRIAEIEVLPGYLDSILNVKSSTAEFDIGERGDAGVSDMDKTYDRVREDVRDFEKRIVKIGEDMNARTIELEKRLMDDRRDLEKRLLEDRRESEARINAQTERMEAKCDRIEEKVDALTVEVRQRNREFTSLSIATILAIAALVVTVLIAVLQNGHG